MRGIIVMTSKIWKEGTKWWAWRVFDERGNVLREGWIVGSKQNAQQEVYAATQELGKMNK